MHVLAQTTKTHTNWTNLQEFYGFRRPFNFKTAIPFLLNACILALLFLTCIVLLLTKNLSIGTERFYYFLYIACFLILGAMLSRVPALSYALLCWCIIELGLGFGDSALYPRNVVFTPNADETAFIYHPLLQLVPRPNYEYTIHLDFSHAEAKAKAGGIDVASLQGQPITFAHNSLGLRGKEVTPDDLRKPLIFVYGGSTTYDAGVTQGETWPERLQADLDNKYTVLNFGVVAHSTEEHVIETAFYQDIVQKQPACAIYYEGWNDVINVHLDKLDSGYANYHVLTTAIRRPDLSLAKYSPLLLLANDMLKGRFDTIPNVPSILGKPPGTGGDARLESIFKQNIRTLAAINQARGTKAIFIGQIINKDWPQGSNIWAPLVKTGDFPPLIERFNSLLKETATSASAKYIDPGVANFAHSDFLDYAHFTALGARKFAALISKEVGSYCQ